MNERKRIAIVYDNRHRPETTGIYCRRGLAELLAVEQAFGLEHLLPDEVQNYSAEDFEHLIFIDDGFEWEIPRSFGSTAWWAIDTHLGFDRCLRMARQVDHVFAAQLQGAEQLRVAGINAEWLPLACDPEIHAAPALEKQFDIAFVGHPVGARRVALLEKLQERYESLFIGQRYFEDMAETYAAASIVFNCSVNGDLNMRVFEAMASGSVLLTDFQEHNGFGRLFRENEHAALYHDDDQLFALTDSLLEAPERCRAMGATARAAVLSEHTYAHRMSVILNRLLGNDRSTSVATPSVSQREVVHEPTAGYYGHARPEVVSLVPDTARQVLDVGCASGKMGAAIRHRQKATVVGIELNPAVALEARKVLDEVHTLDVERDPVEFSGSEFDCCVCADVIEHLREPAVFLKRVRQWLTDDGRLVFSVPNVQHHTVVRSLLEGNFTYQSAGLLDHDHVRFFTRRELEKLLFRAGFQVKDWQPVFSPDYQEWVASGRSEFLDMGELQIRVGSPSVAEDYFTYQFIASAEKRPQPDYGLTSVVIVTHNQRALTEQCVDSIQMRTDADIELIFVDNGSDDGTPGFLDSVPGARVIRNRENRGFPVAANQGIRAAQGQQILLLNNDTIATTGWLERLLEALYSDESLGMVGPLSNNVSGEQQVAAGYTSFEDLDGWAWDHCTRNSLSAPQTVVRTDRLVGFCLLIRRELIQRIGDLDERFGIGCFEDDDLCRRALESGYQLAIATNSFVHHVGSATFQGAGFDLREILQTNQRVYADKWNTGSEVTRSEGTQRRNSNSNSKSTVSLCMIVRDNEDTIRPCLESIRPWVDEIIIVDTGSVDRTPEICKEFDVQLHYSTWPDSFAAARNESIQHATGDWVFWMDSDDTITSECGRKLRDLVDSDHHPGMLGYVMQVHCPGETDGELTVVDHLKLFRNHQGIEFEFRIHEQLLPSIRRLDGEVAFTDIYVIHSGSSHDPAVKAKKIERDLFLLHLELAERGEHPFVLFNLGMTHAEALEHDVAIDYLERCIKVSGEQDSHTRKAYALLAANLMEVGRLENATKIVEQAMSLYPGDKELTFRLAMLHHDQGNNAEARDRYLECLKDDGVRHFMSRDVGIDSFKARHNLAVVYENLGDSAAAKGQWMELIDSFPDYQPGWEGLVGFLSRSGDRRAADSIVTRLESRPDTPFQVLSRRLQSQLAVSQEDVNKGVALLEQALELDPSDMGVHNDLCRLTFERSDPESAIGALQRLIDVCPSDASAHHNLGTCLLRVDRLDEAIAAFRKAVHLRPAHLESQRCLARSFEQYGDTATAMQIWEQILSQLPDDEEANTHLAILGGAEA